MKKIIAIVVSMFIVGLLIGCSSPQPAQPATSGSGNSIGISNFAYQPAVITIHKGETITWTNNDAAPHTVTSDTGTELNSDSLATGATYSHTFNDAGTFEYHCTFHPTMNAKIIVQ